MSAQLWSADSGTQTYFGHGPDGLMWSRWHCAAKPGRHFIYVIGFRLECQAVVDDFGNLVRV